MGSSVPHSTESAAPSWDLGSWGLLTMGASHYIDCGSRFKEICFGFNMVPHSNQLL